MIHSTTTDPTTLTQSTTEVKNSQGQTVSVTDAANHNITYGYDPFGNRRMVTDPKGNVTTPCTTFAATGSSMSIPTRAQHIHL